MIKAIATVAAAVMVGIAAPGIAQATPSDGHSSVSHNGVGHFYTGGPKNGPIPAPGRYPVTLPTWFTNLVHHIFND